MKYQSDPKRIFGLDLFRTLAILAVVVVHGAPFLNKTKLEGFPYFKMYDGVDLFFVLSGFLIGGILLKIINKEGTLSFAQLREFWKRRWFRTLPNYYFVLALNYIGASLHLTSRNTEAFSYEFLLFIHNFWTPFEGFFMESWSLSVEEWFYLITPLIIYFLLKFLPAKRAFLFATLFVLVLPILYRYSIYSPFTDSYTWHYECRQTVLSRLDGIGYGLLAAWILYYLPTYFHKVKWIALGLGILVLLIVINFKVDTRTIYKQVFYGSIYSLSIMMMLPAACAYKTAKGLWSSVIVHISRISYSMYLINLSLVAGFIQINLSTEDNSGSIFHYGLYWILVVFLSSLIYKYFEKPMTSLRDKF